MSYEIDSSFARVEHILPLLHIISAIFIISSQVVLICLTRFFTFYVDKNYGELFKQIKRIVVVILTLLLLLVLTGFLLSNGDDFKYSDPMMQSVIHTKYAISILIFCNFGYVLYRFSLAKKACKDANLEEMKEHLIIAINYFVVLDIFILLISVYLGVVMAEFRW
ncbi:MAG: hypothetical protein GX282_08585 [Campylobacteraceae bacterium]|nr:hypothetical protein [Campylobacteraceae bacterium]